MRKIGAEFILGMMFLPWAIWITISIFGSQKADAVIETKFDNIMGSLKEIKSHFGIIKE